jgi:hypothetical protein
MLNRAGFRDVHIQRFWGHGYFDRMPGLKQATTSSTRWRRGSAGIS